MNTVPEIFSRRRLAQHRARAARMAGDHEFLIDLTADRLVDRLLDFNHDFQSVLIAGDHKSILKKHLNAVSKPFENIDEIDIMDCEVLHVDPSKKYDAIIAHFELPFINDVPGVLLQMRQSLKPDGLLLATTLGTQTLENFRDLLMQAELSVYGGVSQRVGPFVDMQDLAALMQRSGFALPVIDQDIITVEYSARRKLVDDMRGMGWTACLSQPGRIINKAFLQKIELNQPIEAHFETLYITARAPSDAQQKPAARGSGQTSLADHLTE